MDKEYKKNTVLTISNNREITVDPSISFEDIANRIVWNAPTHLDLKDDSGCRFLVHTDEIVLMEERIV